MYCRNCGNLLSAEMKACPTCGTPVEAGPRQCRTCGAVTEDPRATFCSACGTPLAAQTQQPQYGQPPYQQPPYQHYPPQPVYQPKSKVAAGVLGILLGAFGVHNFYLGYTGKAVAQLLITLLSLGILSAVTSIWGLVEGIMLLTGSIPVDGKGVPLQD